MGQDSSGLIERIYDGINSGNLDSLDNLVSHDFVDHGDDTHGVEAFKQRMAMFRSAFPDLHATINEVLVDGDRCATRATITGTHTGDLMGITATGRAIRVGSVDLLRVADGKATERWGGLDTFSLLVQLGAIPLPQPI